MSGLINMRFLRTNKLNFFYIYDAYGGIHITKPALMYNDDGSDRLAWGIA
jgi:hypothetical protein